MDDKRLNTTELVRQREKPLRGAERHPEKRRKAETHSGRKPDWIRVRAPLSENFAKTQKVLRKLDLVTVCEEAACPNIGECWAKQHATFLIMGDICTRACAFCNIATGKPGLLDPTEAERVGTAVADMGLTHVVVTSVDRDDLADGGAEHFRGVIAAIRRLAPKSSIEILTPDFRNKEGALDIVLQSPPDVFNHNLETVPRLYPKTRPGSRYFTSLDLLRQAKEDMPELFTKSGLMVGLGEELEEVEQVMDDMRAANVDFITIGQYLQPTPKHAPIARFIHPDEFKKLEQQAWRKGFLMVSATPLTRSSHHAGEDFQKLQQARAAKLNSTS